MRKPKTSKPPLAVGTLVDINIAQGLNVAQGVITAADYDDGWLYQIDVTAGDRCDAHRNAAGELWVCDLEVKPRHDAEPGSPLPHTVDIVGNQMVVLDRDGNGCDCHELPSLRAAQHQLRRWQNEYTFHYAGALSAVWKFFESVE